MYPPVGECGRFKLQMYRGKKAKSERLSNQFASDPGDYGCGEYWADNYEFAKGYGDVQQKLIELDCVYHIPAEELTQLIEQFRTCKVQDGHEQRLINSQRLTNHFKQQGYQAVLTTGYEDFTTKGLCIFA
ncbi:hypothetical protein [Vibrio sp. SCSIO 43136]|uniref:hypothetical protein n=1 Tax=Vibrio sp. SCSIO 43136 TaxID=2819101 RepID=UPI0020750946|nr:hypothetical protein [Vibrio sp. SCSIO 43136]USD68147.1 hypothetical protein J4N39_18405 [Vibrio sp. SCSIO 43136]